MTGTSDAVPQRPDLAEELVRRAKLDQHARGVREDGQRAEPDHEAMVRVDRDNTTWLETVLDEHGWPGRTLVGEEGASCAWLLAQHADHDGQFQSKALRLLEEAVRAGEAAARHWAYLVDRTRTGRNEPQVYGTQYVTDAAGSFGPRPIEDPDQLDERRTAVGLEPHAEYDARMRERYPH
ncbi:hypothetical protein M1P56_17020 [Streptomyces sp. HU2014]|uniref:DUF6624 domain-containing protein n=1 Tax=Streptomyces sp. HU2014 TaxID=2939414 RepID=UPI0020104984|nr:DUF6624 domain-containing protein [Streptomyces sp. HU2014]UQI45935.1 hypothetical protein M1P56_17020 [Streptomyces sp. HU2014]